MARPGHLLGVRTRPPALAAGGTYVGKVTRVTAAGAFVELPDVAKGLEYGPALYPDHLHPGATTGGGEPGLELHTHPAHVTPLTAGDRVAVAMLTAVEDELVVLTRLG